MLDKRTKKLLHVICKICGESSIQTIDKEELLSLISQKIQFDKENFKQGLHLLSREGYIEVKYQDENVICLSPLPKGRREQEIFDEQKNAKVRVRWKYVLAFSIIFLSQIISTLIALLLFNLV